MEVTASVIVVFRDDLRVTRLIDSLARQTYPQEFIEVIAIENGSQDLLETELPRNVTYRHLPVANMAVARNAGLYLAKGQYVLFTDADCVAHERWIEESVKALFNGAAGVGGKIMRFAPETVTQKFGSNIVNGQCSLNFLPALNLPYVVGANSAFRKELLLEVGGFDPALLSGNDVDICYKLGLGGFELEIAPKAIIFHDNRREILSHFSRFYNYSVYQVALYKKYKNKSGKRFIVNPYPWRLGARAIVSLPHGVMKLIFGKPDSFWTSVLDIIEALGVLLGDLRGIFKYRVIYF